MEATWSDLLDQTHAALACLDSESLEDLALCALAMAENPSESLPVSQHEAVLSRHHSLHALLATTERSLTLLHRLRREDDAWAR